MLLHISLNLSSTFNEGADNVDGDSNCWHGGLKPCAAQRARFVLEKTAFLSDVRIVPITHCGTEIESLSLTPNESRDPSCQQFRSHPYHGQQSSFRIGGGSEIRIIVDTVSRAHSNLFYHQMTEESWLTMQAKIKAMANSDPPRPSWSPTAAASAATVAEWEAGMPPDPTSRLRSNCLSLYLNIYRISRLKTSFNEDSAEIKKQTDWSSSLCDHIWIQCHGFLATVGK